VPVRRRSSGAGGYRTLVVERLDKVGGRAWTDEIDGFKVNNGAIVIEVGGITQHSCEEVGAPLDIREPKPPLLYRIGGKDVDVTGGGWGFLLSKLTRQGAKLVEGVGAARNDSGLLEDEITTAKWVSRYTKNEGVQGHLPQHVSVDLRCWVRGSAGPGSSPISPAKARSNGSGSTRRETTGAGT
jgi:hypothetical protein